MAADEPKIGMLVMALEAHSASDGTPVPKIASDEIAPCLWFDLSIERNGTPTLSRPDSRVETEMELPVSPGDKIAIQHKSAPGWLINIDGMRAIMISK